MSDGDVILQTDRLRFGYPRQDVFLGPVDLRIAAGQTWGIIGPNGAGKSTLLRLVVGLLTPTQGQVSLDGQPVARLSAVARARLAAFLPQKPVSPAGATAREVVLLGRFPYRQHRLFESQDDVRIADEALASTETSEFADRRMETLSGGEAQRVHLAAALAQQPRLLVLDEPTAALDPYHQLHLFSILAAQARQTGLAVLVATHDLNLAGRFCDRLLLLHAGRAAAAGPPREVLEPEVLADVYRVAFRGVTDTADGQRLVWPVMAGQPAAASQEDRP